MEEARPTALLCPSGFCLVQDLAFLADLVFLKIQLLLQLIKVREKVIS